MNTTSNTSHKVEIYTTPYCPYCIRAKRLLVQKNVDFIEYDISGKPDLRAEMEQRSAGRKTVPQVFIDNEGVGGCDDLFAKDKAGQLPF